MDGDNIRIGKALIDPVRGNLSRAGRPVALDRPASAILKLLAQEAGNDVEKDRLLEAGWPGRVVHENSLAKAIGRLREGLGRDAGALHTVHGFGYRLDLESQRPSSPGVAAIEGRLRRRGPILSAGAIVLAGAMALGWQTLARTERTEPRLAKGEPADAVGRVLWVDDHPQNNLAERRYLEARKIAVYQVTTTEAALQLLAMYEYGAVISDMNRHDDPLAGIALVTEMRRRDDRTPFVLYSVVPSEAQRRFVAEAGGQAATVTPGELYRAVLPRFEQR